MGGKIKFHLIAISSIVLVIMGVYFLQQSMNAPEEVPDGTPAEERLIIIAHANWGLNCNRYIEYRNKQNARKEEFKPRALIQENNMLSKVAQFCNGKKVCEFVADDKTFGTERVQSCAKRFQVVYRCFEYDRPWEINANPREKITINCKDK